MSIADKKYFSKEYISDHRGNAPAHLAELAVYSLEMVAALVKEGLKFRFKGGNSLLVLLEEPRRFSIDADISTDETKERIEECLDRAVKSHDLFTEWKPRPHQTKPWLPMTSYYIFFNSHFSKPEDSFIMLDAVLHNSQYASVNKVVQCTDLYQSDQVCELPSVSSLIGDKMLTLGPSTQGIPIGKKKEAQRLKHVHDVSLLASRSPDLDEMRESIRLCMEQENNIQETSFKLTDIYQDTINFLSLPFKTNNVPETDDGNPYLKEIIVGMETFASFLFSGEYSWQRLQLDTARAALCFTAIICADVKNEDLLKVLNSPDTDAAVCWENIKKMKSEE